MTTIAYRDGVMSADSCLSEGKGEENTLYVGSVDKLFRLDDGSMLGLSGDAEGAHVVKILNDHANAPNAEIVDLLLGVGASCRGILVKPDGRTFWIATNITEKGADDEEDDPYTEYQEFRDRFAAVGSGAWIAYGAMEGHKDVTARMAVEAACRRHPYTRPPITEMRLLAPKQSRRRVK